MLKRKIQTAPSLPVGNEIDPVCRPQKDLCLLGFDVGRPSEELGFVPALVATPTALFHFACLPLSSLYPFSRQPGPQFDLSPGFGRSPQFPVSQGRDDGTDTLALQTFHCDPTPQSRLHPGCGEGPRQPRRTLEMPLRCLHSSGAALLEAEKGVVNSDCWESRGANQGTRNEGPEQGDGEGLRKGEKCSPGCGSLASSPWSRERLAGPAWNPAMAQGGKEPAGACFLGGH